MRFYLFFAASALIALQEPAQIRVTTRMVEVGVIVHDANGGAVTALRAEDFRLLDGGHEEQIRVFAAGGAGASSASDGQPHVATAILLDYFNTRFGDEAFGRAELLRFLREMEPRQPVALLSLEAGFRVLQDFTTDAGSLVRTLEHHRPYRPIHAATFRPFKFHFPRRYGNPNEPQYDADVGRAVYVDSSVESMKAALREKEMASSVAALASYLAHTPGRKNLIWVSSKFPWQLAAALRHDDVAVYPVDASTPTGGPTEAALMLAARTGGVAFDHGNSVTRGIRQSFADIGTAYAMGYYPSHEQWNGQFRRIQVSVNRPGVEVRHRAGYVAAADGDFRAPDQRDVLWYVAVSPGEATGTALSAKATQLEDGAFRLSLVMDPQTLPAEVLVVPQRTDGETMTADYFVLQTGGIAEASPRITPPPEARALRVVVRETRTGALGSTTVALHRKK